MAAPMEPIVAAPAGMGGRPPLQYHPPTLSATGSMTAPSMPGQQLQQHQSTRLTSVPSFGSMASASARPGQAMQVYASSGQHQGVKVVVGAGGQHQVVRMRSLQGSVRSLQQPSYTMTTADGQLVSVSPAVPPVQGYIAHEEAAAADGIQIPASPSGGESIEALKRTVRAQEECIEQLRRELATCKMNERKTATDAEVARQEVDRLTEEVRLERSTRQELEGTLAEHFQAQDRKILSSSSRAASYQAASSYQGRLATGGTPRSSKLGNSRGNSSERVTRVPAVPERPAPNRGSPRTRAASPSSRGVLPPKQKDEIDIRLQEFQEKTPGLVWRRLNKGWYGFKRDGDKDGEERNCEVSIVKGKLMCKFEPSSHDAGWNNGKLGPIERFAAAMTA